MPSEGRKPSSTNSGMSSLGIALTVAALPLIVFWGSKSCTVLCAPVAMEMLWRRGNSIVVGSEDVRAEAAFKAVYGHQGSFGSGNIDQRVGMGAADDAVHLIGEEHLQVALLLLGVVIAIAENDPVALGQVALETVHHLPVEGVCNRGR